VALHTNLTARRFFKPQPERTTTGLMHPNALRSGMVQDTRHSAWRCMWFANQLITCRLFRNVMVRAARANFPRAFRTIECRNFAQLILTRVMQK